MSFINDIAPLILSIGVAAIPVVGGVLSPLVLAVMRQRNLNTDWYEAVARAGGVAYQNLVSSGRPVTDKTALADAAFAGAHYLLERLPLQSKDRGLEAPDLAQIARAELGRLLALDPGVTPTPGVLAPTVTTDEPPINTLTRSTLIG